ncbi:uncharacterized protein LOC144094215 [Amblyomma americanum]
MALREGTTPAVQTARRVPLALRELLRLEIEQMENAGIITKVTEATDWDHTSRVRPNPCRDPPGPRASHHIAQRTSMRTSMRTTRRTSIARPKASSGRWLHCRKVTSFRSYDVLTKE